MSILEPAKLCAGLAVVVDKRVISAVDKLRGVLVFVEVELSECLKQKQSCFKKNL